AHKERVGSRLRRRYEAPQTPLQRLAACEAADPGQVAELRRLRARLDPFQLSASIDAKLKAIFALSREAPAPSRAPRPQASAPAPSRVRPRGMRMDSLRWKPTAFQ